MSATLPLLAGITSTVVFAVSTVPMLVKAGRTTDMSSYSLGNIVLVNVGNVVHSVYVFHLPAGPIWALHLFYLVSSAVQLTWYLRYLPRTRASLSNVALHRVRVGTSGYGPTDSVRAPLRRRRLDRSEDRLDDAQVAFGRISEDAQRSPVFRADRMRSKATKATGAQNMDRRARATARGLEGQRRKERVARLRFPEPSPRGRIPLTATGLSKSFGSLEVFTDVDLAVDRGSRVVVLGLAGAGKTTLPRILARIEPPDNRHGGAGGTGCSWATKPRSTRPLRHHAERAGERAGGSPGPLGGEGATGAGHGPFLR
jgi:ABC-type multidrug transport system fused ATPase/permease subunit